MAIVKNVNRTSGILLQLKQYFSTGVPRVPSKCAAKLFHPYFYFSSTENEDSLIASSKKTIFRGLI